MAQKIEQKEYIIELPKKVDARGNLSFLEEGQQIPFKIARVYWIYDVPGGQKRGSHAFKNQEEIIIALSGSFNVVLNDGKETRCHQLNRAYNALYVPSKMWRTLENFSTNSVCLVISSGEYNEDEYIRNYREFKRFLKSESDQHPTKHLGANNEITQKKIPYLDYSLINLPVIKNRAGNLTFVQNSIDIPFDIKRIFFIYDIPSGQIRGMHAHKYCHEFMLSACGSFDVELDDGKEKKSISMNSPMQGLYIKPNIWKKQFNYSTGAICLVLTSDNYSEDDYIRKYSDFKKHYANRD